VDLLEGLRVLWKRNLYLVKWENHIYFVIFFVIVDLMHGPGDNGQIEAK
jgi:hypothetical protein